MVETYMSFGAPADTGNLTSILGAGAMPVLQLNPYSVSLTSVAGGRYDAYLKRFALSLSQLGHPVVLSFAAEANGIWYSWSCRHTTAATYIAAWRHVHNVISRYDPHVIWMWDVNVNFAGACPLTARWPGPSYVDWVGVDGYLRQPGASFANVLAPTMTTLRSFTGKPMLIAETGVPNSPEAASWLASIFSGAEAIPGMIGVVYFDAVTSKHNYRLEQDPPARTVFQHWAKIYQSTKRS
jgi:mannan endo-1,4-beta-mannosidase